MEWEIRLLTETQDPAQGGGDLGQSPAPAQSSAVGSEQVAQGFIQSEYETSKGVDPAPLLGCPHGPSSPYLQPEPLALLLLRAWLHLLRPLLLLLGVLVRMVCFIALLSGLWTPASVLISITVTYISLI